MHVVFAWLDTLDDERETLSGCLSAEERARANRFTFARDRERYTRRRGLLRQILSSHTGIDAAAIRFEFTGNGKPILAGAYPHQFVHFNASHSNGLAVYAVSKAGAVGIDIEKIKAFANWRELAREHFVEAEQRELFGVCQRHQLEAFYRGWTRKEALLKAMAEGIGDGLRRVVVSLVEPVADARSIDGSAEAADRWRIYEMPVPGGYVGAVCARNPVIGIEWTTKGRRCDGIGGESDVSELVSSPRRLLRNEPAV
jgi:4'-phosphopantetheinyl transferase